MFGLFINRPGVACGKLQISLYAQEADSDLPGKGPVMHTGRERYPQHFPTAHTGSALFCTSNPHGRAQQASKSETV
jgi:hypothetical protein